MNHQITTIKKEIQLIINNIAINNFSETSIKLIGVTDLINDLIDTTKEEEILVELSKYQLLLNHLQIKMSIKE